MKRAAVLVFALSVLSIFSIAASAKVLTGMTGGDKECSANHYHVNDLVSYAEMREQRLALASMNYINPGQNGSIRVHGWDKGDVLVRACVQTAGKLSPMPVQLRRKFLSRAGPERLSRKGLQEASVCIGTCRMKSGCPAIHRIWILTRITAAFRLAPYTGRFDFIRKTARFIWQRWVVMWTGERQTAHSDRSDGQQLEWTRASGRDHQWKRAVNRSGNLFRTDRSFDREWRSAY